LYPFGRWPPSSKNSSPAPVQPHHYGTITIMARLKRLILPILLLLAVSSFVYYTHRQLVGADATRRLYQAVELQDLDTVRQLLDAGANPDARQQQPDPPRGLVALVKALLGRGRSKGKGPRVLTRAVVTDSQTIVRLLLDRGAQPEYYDDANYQGTPLCLAANIGADDVANLLIEHGANVDSHNSNGQTALMNAAWGTNTVKVIQTLVQHGAGLNARDDSGDRPLIYACYGHNLRPNEKSIRLLLELGADPNVANRLKEPPLSIVSKAHDKQMAALLKRYGAKR